MICVIPRLLALGAGELVGRALLAVVLVFVMLYVGVAMAALIAAMWGW
jgi:hypothetical protein